jgi:hypothetical protein
MFKLNIGKRQKIVQKKLKKYNSIDFRNLQKLEEKYLM